MTGICAYGVYIPLYRLALSEIAAATGGFAQDGEKAVDYNGY
jgi:3-hydroxy-3-methylglutaryl CoA synthase